MFHATFVLSTGRCGTQWLAAKLDAVYRDALKVEHEPLHNGYEPRLMLGAGSPAGLPAEATGRILAHVEKIERSLETRDYVECGHPCWSSLPYLADRFAGRVRIVHLVRHPVPTAMSWLTHSAFVTPFLPHLTEKVLLSPFDQGVVFGEYKERWASMTPFEKCLYYWAEVNAFALRLEKTFQGPWLRLTAEELFGGEGLVRMLGFLGLGVRDPIVAARAQIVDVHRFMIGSAIPDPAVLDAHPVITRTARCLGYESATIDLNMLRQRYGTTS